MRFYKKDGTSFIATISEYELTEDHVIQGTMQFNKEFFEFSGHVKDYLVTGVEVDFRDSHVDAHTVLKTLDTLFYREATLNLNEFQLEQMLPKELRATNTKCLDKSFYEF